MESLEKKCLKVLLLGNTTVLWGDFDAHVGNDSKTWKGVIWKNDLTDLNTSGEFLY